MTKKFFVTMLAIITFINIANAQVKNELKDSLAVKHEILNNLKKAEPGDIDSSKPMKLDPSTTPMYYENFVLIKKDDLMKILMSGDYRPVPYIDSKKVVKALVFRKATELEKEQMKQMKGNIQNPGQNNNELIGKEAFPFSVTDISGNQYSLEKLKGKLIVLNFWFKALYSNCFALPYPRLRSIWYVMKWHQSVGVYHHMENNSCIASACK